MSENSAPTFNLILLILLGFPVAFLAIWAFTCWLIALIGGWSRLAQQYPARNSPSGKRFAMQFGTVGIASYRNVLTVDVTSEGLYLSVMRLFRIAHPPLFIPWSAIHNPRPRRWFWYDVVEFDVGIPRVATVRLPSYIMQDDSTKRSLTF